MKTSVLKPGFLVSLKTSLRGNVTYRRQDIESEYTTDAGAIRAKWETEKEIADPNEFKAGTEARSEARAAVAKVCAYSPNFGFLCPLEKENELDAAIEIARGIAREFNATANLSQLVVSVITGRIAQDDAEAARAIGNEIRELLDAMRAGIAAADPGAIREAANKARNLGSMLSADVAGQVSAAIVQAREAARAITRRVEKAGERAADVVAELQTNRISAARFAFLDIDGAEAEREMESIAPAGRGIDLAPEEENRPAVFADAGPTTARTLELF